MRRLLLVAMFMLFGLSAATVHADENAPLGRGTIGVKFGGVAFTDAPLGAEDLGLYVGVEGYYKITEDMPLYLGAEIGASESSVAANEDKMRFVPYEINLKYAKKTNTPPFNFIVDVGGGLSLIYADYSDKFQFQPTVGVSEWLFGGQVFVDLIDVWNDWFFVGINLKYQLTGNLDDASGNSVDYSNFRSTVQLGVVF